MLLLATAAFASQPIVGGHPARAGDWPDAAAVAFDAEVACTGTLVTPDLVLTAGHCAEDGVIAYVVLGSTDDEHGDEIAVDRVDVHPDPLTTYDVALLHLSERAKELPRPIARDCILADLRNGATVDIVGYGATDEDATVYGHLLEQAETTISDVDCTQGRGCNAAVSPGGELVAGGGGVDTCNGDSGGPLYLPTVHGTYLAGVTSRGVVPSSRPCGEGGIYVRADAVVDWIEATSGETLPVPDCGPPNQPPAPTAGAMHVLAGADGTTRVTPNDPDSGQHFAYAIAKPPQQGHAEVTWDGFVLYTADADAAGADPFDVSVTDDGYPPQTGTVTIPVSIARAPAHGCETAPSGAWLALLLVRRRR